MTSQNGINSQQEFYNIIDNRTYEQKQYQIEVSDEIHAKGIKALGIKMTHRRKTKYQISNPIKVDLGNNWYANITDNCKKSEFTIFTMHGAPGDHIQWAGLQTQMWDTCRWVNFIVPGFDGEDQRRGNYTGSCEDLSQMIIQILKVRKIPQIVFCGHSMGSIFASYFITNHPEYVRGYINITGIVNRWYTGLLTFYRITVVAYGFNKGPNKKSLLRLLNKDEYREKHHARFIQETRDIFFGPIQFPELTLTEMCAYIKLFSSFPDGCSMMFSLNKKLTLPRILLFGKKDPLHQDHSTSEQIYQLCRGDLNWHRIPENHRVISNSAFQEQLKETLMNQLKIQIDPMKLQQYFCYHFEDTGHNAHRRRPKQISKIIRVYLITLGVFEKYSRLLSSKL